ncbi:MAG: tripartite tricarboxylate transporter TctB family protein [Rhodocyclales bacterium]|nr:tripartite tricarboxylate transporter TctB family protein [Rhodocyclales bacterium]
MELRLKKGSLQYLMVLAIAVGLFLGTGQISGGASGSDQLGPAFWPRLILGLTICVCVFEIGFRQFTDMEGMSGLLAQVTSEMEKVEGAVEEESGEANPLRLISGVILTLLYVWVMPEIGFTLSTFLYTGLFIRMGGYRKLAVTAVVSLLGTLLLVFLFMKVVYVSLPLGKGVFGEISIALLPLLGIR